MSGLEDKHYIDNLTDRELIRMSYGTSDQFQCAMLDRFESVLNELESVEGGVEDLKKEVLSSIRTVKTLIGEGELSKARTEANCLKVKVSKSTEAILNLIQGN